MRAICRLLAVLALGLAGCGITIIDDPGRHAQLDAAVRQAAIELNQHHASLEAATSLAQARVEVERHGRAMETCAGGVRRDVNVMICGGGYADMMGLMASFDGRVAAYQRDAAAAPTLAALHAIGEDYFDDMAQILDRLGDRADALRCHEP